jgi:hypothetical protein
MITSPNSYLESYPPSGKRNDVGVGQNVIPSLNNEREGL